MASSLHPMREVSPPVVRPLGVTCQGRVRLERPCGREVTAMTDHDNGSGLDEAALRREIARLQHEVGRTRTHRSPGAAGEEIARLDAGLPAGQQNERLAGTLREARDQIVALKAEVDRLAQPPTPSACSSPRRRRARSRCSARAGRCGSPISPSVEVESLVPGQELDAQRGVQRRGRPGVRAGRRGRHPQGADGRTTAPWSWPTPTRSVSCTWRALCAMHGSGSATR